jgi:hypothetical protein
MPTIQEKVIEAFQNRIRKEFLRKEIIDLVVNQYPGTNRSSVIPSDYCYNMVNAGINFDFHFFESLGEKEGRYRCLGHNYQFTGAIYWKPMGAICEQVGEWQNGRFQLWQNAPERARLKWGINHWIDPRQQGN